MGHFDRRRVLGETVAELLLRIAEVEACIAAESGALRSPELQPSLDEFPTGAELQAATSALCSRRRALLGPRVAHGVREPGGRVLVCEYNLTLCSGESELKSNEFFDINDRPPWNLWLTAGVVAPSVAGTREPTEVLLAWVPKQLVDRAQSGIAVNPYDCIFWASEAQLPFRDALGGASMLEMLETQGAP
jgi:hypothetical protein